MILFVMRMISIIANVTICVVYTDAAAGTNAFKAHLQRRNTRTLALLQCRTNTLKIRKHPALQLHSSLESPCILPITDATGLCGILYKYTLLKSLQLITKLCVSLSDISILRDTPDQIIHLINSALYCCGKPASTKTNQRLATILIPTLRIAYAPDFHTLEISPKIQYRQEF